jgi:hypothetical protein
MGVYKALVESHFSVDFVFDETATGETLQSYPVVILANVAAMTTAEVDMFSRYVESGGNLVATAETSLYDENGEPLTEFQLADLFGVRYLRTNDCDNCYFRKLPALYAHEIDARYYVLSPGGVQIVEATSAEPRGDLHEAFFKRSLPDRFFSHNIHPPYERIGDAVYFRQVGQGTSTYLPFRLGAAYADPYELPEHRQLWASVIRSVHPEPLVAVQAPLNTEVIVREAADCVYVHLVTYNPLRQAKTLPKLDQPIVPSQRMEEPLLYRAQLQIKFPYRAVSSVSSTPLEESADGTIRLLTDRIHEIIAIQK